MQVLRILVVGSLLFLSVLHTAAAAPVRDGNALLRGCTLAIRLVDTPEATRTEVFERPDLVMDAGYCFGLLRGMADMNKLWQMYTKDTSMYFCLPPQSNMGQWMRVVVKYLQAHPEQLHEEATGLVSLAFTNAFPCLPKAQHPRR
jgi:Ssp1 endopeptidase immunity protein Rap1a